MVFTIAAYNQQYDPINLLILKKLQDLDVKTDRQNRSSNRSSETDYSTLKDLVLNFSDRITAIENKFEKRIDTLDQKLATISDAVLEIRNNVNTLLLRQSDADTKKAAAYERLKFRCSIALGIGAFIVGALILLL